MTGKEFDPTKSGVSSRRWWCRRAGCDSLVYSGCFLWWRDDKDDRWCLISWNCLQVLSAIMEREPEAQPAHHHLPWNSETHQEFSHQRMSPSHQKRMPSPPNCPKQQNKICCLLLILNKYDYFETSLLSFSSQSKTPTTVHKDWGTCDMQRCFCSCCVPSKLSVNAVEEIF